MKVYQSKFLECDFFTDSHLLDVKWLPETTSMSIDEYKIEFMNYFTIFEKLIIKKIIVDERDLYFIVTPTLQEWVNVNVHAQMPLLDLAIVVSSDLIIELAVEQLLTEKESKDTFTVRYFHNKEEAQEWILSF